MRLLHACFLFVMATGWCCLQVGAGSLVLHDLPPNCVAVGVPARVVKQATGGQDTKATDFMVETYLDYQI
jgi:serine acetyltransferase